MPDQAYGGSVPVAIRCNVTGVEDAFPSIQEGLGVIAELRRVVLEYADELQAQAVLNVSGVTVSYSGGTFVVNRQTGNLSRSISVIPGFGGGPLSAIVVASTDYASHVEFGTKSVDMKALMMGKTIPFPVSGTMKEKKALVKQGLASHVHKRLSKYVYSTSKYEYIAFRKIGPKSKGWIIPAMKPRPFMAAAAETIRPAFEKALLEVFTRNMNG